MTEVENNMEVDTESEEILKGAQGALDRFMDMSFPPRCKDLEDVFNYLYPTRPVRLRPAERTPAVSFDPLTCINCGRCVAVCADVMGINAIDEDSSMAAGNCVSCGQCTTVCLTDAMRETPATAAVLGALGAGRAMVLVVSPSSCVSLGEMFGDPVGTNVTGKVVTVARALGFRFVFDEGFGQDVTLVATADELLRRKRSGSRLPLFGCPCPATISLIEKFYPDLQELLMPIRAPANVIADLVRGPFAAARGISPESIFVVHLTPCVASKAQVECALTTREFGQLVTRFGIEWSLIGDGQFDPPWHESSSAAALSQVSSGFAQGVIWSMQTTANAPPDDLDVWRKMSKEKPVTSGTMQIDGLDFRFGVCAAPGARDLIVSGKYKKYDFVEVMACPGGCVFGGGQPKLGRAAAARRADAIRDICQKAIHRVPLAVEAVRAVPLDQIKTAFEPQPVASPKRHRLPVVAFGSGRGRSLRYARLIAGFMDCASVAMNQLEVSRSLVNYRQIVFVTSTIHSGDVPMSAQYFIKRLEETSEDLSGLNFAVLALGRSNFGQNFAKTGKRLFALLEKNKATPKLPLYICDEVEPDRGRSTFIKFCDDLARALFLPKPKPGLFAIVEAGVVDDTSILDKPSRPIGFERVDIVGREVSSAGDSEDTFHRYTFKLPDGLTFAVGDCVDILPENDPEQVAAVMSALKYDPKLVVKFAARQGDDKNVIPEKVSLLQLFTQFLDLNCAPARSMLNAFYGVANDLGKRELRPYLDENTEDQWASLLRDVNVAEVIVRYSKYGIPEFNNLISVFPPIIPRLFSIASGPLANPGFFDVFVLDVHFGPKKNRHGITTAFLADPNTKTVWLRAIRSLVQYPKDADAPIILIAVGSALAQLFPMFEHRKAIGAGLAPAILFFEAKYKGSYPLVMKKLTAFKESGILQDVFIAWTAQEEGRKHVHELLKENQSTVWNMWENPKTQLFYCGPPRGVIDDVREILCDITVTEGWLAREEAMAFSSRHVWNLNGEALLSS
jgi:sulfite reductase alpha subunit-like flavoprotein/iron only hydrogenase large subunit-like protein